MVKVYTLDAFAHNHSGGNPAGVVLGADSLTADQMQQVAAKVGFSETAFMEESVRADYKLRYFTPGHEVDVCGHATIATFSLMFTQGQIRAGIYSLETGAGILEVNVQADGYIYLAQALPQFGDILDKLPIAESLRISPGALTADLPVQIVSTGLRDILVPVDSVEMLRWIKPDFAQIIEICRQHNVVGYHLFALDTPAGTTAECRNFAPLYDIPEESATGTSSGALLCYLYHHGRLSAEQAREVVLAQGYAMNQPSEIRGRLSITADQHISKIEIGGMAANIQLISIDL